MATKVKQNEKQREPVHKRTKQGGRKQGGRVVKTSAMNKHEKRNYKQYRGQGR
jgi:hypothetical protein